MLLFFLACTQAPAAAPTPLSPSAPAFDWGTWGDGKAEVAAYTLSQPRYGSVHTGTITLITVTEDFSWSERVKADPGAHPENDIRKVLKLNANRAFLTGIYPYSVMTSAFLRIDSGDGMRAYSPIKATFSAQEWCGMVYSELVMGPKSVGTVSHTYFDSDTAPPSKATVPEGTVYGDALPLVVRGFTSTAMSSEGVTVPYFPAQMDTRFAHEPAELGEITLSLGAKTTAPGPGNAAWPVHEVRSTVEGSTTTWLVETAPPHRILGWSNPTTGESATLTGVERLPYWSLNKPGDEAVRGQLGLGS